MSVIASEVVTGTEGGTEVSSEGLKVPFSEEALSSKLASLIEEVNEELTVEAAQNAADIDPTTKDADQT